MKATELKYPFKLGLVGEKSIRGLNNDSKINKSLARILVLTREVQGRQTSGLEGICVQIVFLNDLLQRNPALLPKMQTIGHPLKTTDLESEGGILDHL